jgi:hypothetical protein
MNRVCNMNRVATNNDNEEPMNQMLILTGMGALSINHHLIPQLKIILSTERRVWFMESCRLNHPVKKSPLLTFNYTVFC